MLHSFEKYSAEVLAFASIRHRPLQPNAPVESVNAKGVVVMGTAGWSSLEHTAVSWSRF